MRELLRGDLHTHSSWSDGGSPIQEMVASAMEVGHEYMALTDHSRGLRVANGLSADRLRKQLDLVRSSQALITDDAPVPAPSAAGAAPGAVEQELLEWQRRYSALSHKNVQLTAELVQLDRQQVQRGRGAAPDGSTSGSGSVARPSSAIRRAETKTRDSSVPTSAL